MFDDGKLARALAAEEKSGLTLSFDGEQMILIGREWMAMIPQDMLREKYRQTLGHLVEALGYVPERELLEIRKAKGEYVITHPLQEVIGEHVGHFLGREVAEAKYTGLTRNGRALLQIRTGTIWACAMCGPGMSTDEVRLTEADTLKWTDENTGEELYRTVTRPREDDAAEVLLNLWNHLEAWSWCEWPKDEQDEIDGQEDLFEEEDGDGV